jgi:transcriptional regulator with GAF, ATPase, and Fis domain/tetratricopeptide (TPR) repeat protein
MAQYNMESKKRNKHILRQLNANEKELAHYLIHMNSPVSIDSLCLVSGKSPVSVLNIMERLRSKKIIQSKKGYEKGIYFFDDADFRPVIDDLITRDINTLRKIIDFYLQTLHEGNDKTLLLAKLYTNLGHTEEGLTYVGRAADILYRSGEKKKALTYYEYILAYFTNRIPVGKDITLFLESILRTALLTTEANPSYQEVSPLIKAEQIAKDHNEWEFLVSIRAEIIRRFMITGHIKQAYASVDDFQNLAKTLGDPQILRLAGLMKSEFFFLDGFLSDAIRSYEEFIGDLEEFGDDEATLKTGAVIGWCHHEMGRTARGMGMINAIRDKAHSLSLAKVITFADLMKVHCLLTIRRFHDAEILLDAICQVLNETARDYYESWAIHSSWAYILYTKENYWDAIKCCVKAEEAASLLGWEPKAKAWVFEYLTGLESKGFSHKKVNYEALIEDLCSSHDIYEKGFALKFRALRNMSKGYSDIDILEDLDKSEECLSRAGAEIELARTRIALGEYYLKKGDTTTAQPYLDKAWRLLSTVDKSLFPTHLMSIIPREDKIDFMVNRIIDITASLGKIHEASLFLEQVLNVAMDFTHATRGSFLVLDSGGPRVIASRNVDFVALGSNYSNFVREIILDMARNNLEARVFEPSNLLYNAYVKSLVCMAAKLGDSMYGYLYVDNHLGNTPFPQDVLPFVKMLCTQIAVGLSNIDMFNEMKELKDRFEGEAVFYKQEMGIATPLEMIIGHSEPIIGVTNEIQQVAPTDSVVLILGETGVGKELVAKAVHNLSKRKDGPFIPINLAALPQELVASELFGHEKGAFTGANERQRGRFELADDGTIFLDEIGDLTPAVQVKLLRVLQEGTFERVGSSKPIRSNFRVIAATNKNLQLQVERGTFRQDLYYRLNTFPIYVPPLRERIDDIPHLAHHFVEKYGKKMGKSIRRIPADEMKKLLDYHWPGNVRELEHIVERAIILSDGHGITFSGLHHSAGNLALAEDSTFVSLSDHEREYIQKVLATTGWRINGPRGAALVLGMKPSTLFYRIKKLGIQIPRTLSSSPQ